MKNAQAALQDERPFEKPAIWKRRWFQNAGIAAFAVIAVYVLIAVDVASRAREAFLQAETYMAWHKDPEAKKRHFEAAFAAGKSKLDADLASKTISDKDYRRRLDALEFDRDFALSESSLKYAYQWYKDAYELYSPPESRWVRQARQKAPEVLALWKDELRAQKVPFEDFMFE